MINELSKLDEEFGKDLQVFAKDVHSKLIQLMKNNSLEIFDITMKIPVDAKFIEKFKLNQNISFNLHINRNMQVMYNYKNIDLDPICHYITPDNYVPVPTLTILHEAIKQDTHKPDIKPLELELARANELANKDKGYVVERLD